MITIVIRTSKVNNTADSLFSGDNSVTMNAGLGESHQDTSDGREHESYAPQATVGLLLVLRTHFDSLREPGASRMTGPLVYD